MRSIGKKIKRYRMKEKCKNLDYKIPIKKDAEKQQEEIKKKENLKILESINFLSERIILAYKNKKKENLILSIKKLNETINNNLNLKIEIKIILTKNELIINLLDLLQSEIFELIYEITIFMIFLMSLDEQINKQLIERNIVNIYNKVILFIDNKKNEKENNLLILEKEKQFSIIENDNFFNLSKNENIKDLEVKMEILDNIFLGITNLLINYKLSRNFLKEMNFLENLFFCFKNLENDSDDYLNLNQSFICLIANYFRIRPFLEFKEFKKYIYIFFRIYLKKNNGVFYEINCEEENISFFYVLYCCLEFDENISIFFDKHIWKLFFQRLIHNLNFNNFIEVQEKSLILIYEFLSHSMIDETKKNYFVEQHIFEELEKLLEFKQEDIFLYSNKIIEIYTESEKILEIIFKKTNLILILLKNIFLSEFEKNRKINSLFTFSTLIEKTDLIFVQEYFLKFPEIIDKFFELIIYKEVKNILILVYKILKNILEIGEKLNNNIFTDRILDNDKLDVYIDVINTYKGNDVYDKYMDLFEYYCNED